MKLPIENHIFLICVSVGLISILAGWILMKYPPKEINSLYGYRTKSSMKNQERWNFAQQYSGKEMMRCGGILSLFGGIGFFYDPGEYISMAIGLGAMILSFVILIFRVENALKRRFR